MLHPENPHTHPTQPHPIFVVIFFLRLRPLRTSASKDNPWQI